MKKLKEEEINQIKLVQSQYSDLVFQIGEIELTKIELEKSIADLKNTKSELLQKLEELQLKSNSIKEQLLQEYGDGDIDLINFTHTKV